MKKWQEYVENNQLKKCKADFINELNYQQRNQSWVGQWLYGDAGAERYAELTQNWSNISTMSALLNYLADFIIKHQAESSTLVDSVVDKSLELCGKNKAELETDIASHNKYRVTPEQLRMSGSGSGEKNLRGETVIILKEQGKAAEEFLQKTLKTSSANVTSF